ncbi:YkgJ family cysteine cluster protein [Patescibacteria group bacterium]
MVKKCHQCGICCRLFYINLSEKEYFSGQYQNQLGDPEVINDYSKASACGANLLKTRGDSSCIYLKNNRCSIHHQRPQVCQEFFCTSKSKKFKGMIKIIERAKQKVNPA